MPIFNLRPAVFATRGLPRDDGTHANLDQLKHHCVHRFFPRFRWMPAVLEETQSATWATKGVRFILPCSSHARRPATVEWRRWEDALGCCRGREGSRTTPRMVMVHLIPHADHPTLQHYLTFTYPHSVAVTVPKFPAEGLIKVQTTEWRGGSEDGRGIVPTIRFHLTDLARWISGWRLAVGGWRLTCKGTHHHQCRHFGITTGQEKMSRLLLATPSGNTYRKTCRDSLPPFPPFLRPAILDLGRVAVECLTFLYNWPPPYPRLTTHDRIQALVLALV
ncbi:hypothetical protein VTG60DRAFT_2636 [Thermothelomyces hinnuleus]